MAESIGREYFRVSNLETTLPPPHHSFHCYLFFQFCAYRLSLCKTPLTFSLSLSLSLTHSHRLSVGLSSISLSLSLSLYILSSNSMQCKATYVTLLRRRVSNSGLLFHHWSIFVYYMEDDDDG